MGKRLRQPATEEEAAEPDQRADAAQCALEIGQTPCDILIVDHYGLGKTWEQAMRPHARLLVVIDDLGRDHEADLCLDQNLPVREGWYAEKAMVGPEFALLNPTFAERAGEFAVREVVDRVLVSFGGGPPVGLIPKVVSEVREFWEGALRRQAGSLGAREAQGEQPEGVASGAGARKKITVLLPDTHMDAQNLPDCDVRWLGQADLPALMLEHDLMIGAGGSTSWERCALGMPSIVLTTAANQQPLTRALHSRGATLPLGDIAGLPSALQQLADKPARQKMSEIAKTVTDGKGAARVAERILQELAKR